MNNVILLTDLVRLLRENAGVDEGVDLDGDILDTAFYELGYDSLALLQLVGVIRREYGADLADEAVAAETPREFLDLVNAELSQPIAA
jgi:act minimal PKS acyl carrier protein